MVGASTLIPFVRKKKVNSLKNYWKNSLSGKVPSPYTPLPSPSSHLPRGRGGNIFFKTHWWLYEYIYRNSTFIQIENSNIQLIYPMKEQKQHTAQELHNTGGLKAMVGSRNRCNWIWSQMDMNCSVSCSCNRRSCQRRQLHWGCGAGCPRGAVLLRV